MNSYQAIAKEVCRMLDFQPSTIIFTIINLLVLYFFFRKFLFGRVNAMLTYICINSSQVNPFLPK